MSTYQEMISLLKQMLIIVSKHQLSSNDILLCNRIDNTLKRSKIETLSNDSMDKFRDELGRINCFYQKQEKKIKDLNTFLQQQQKRADANDKLESIVQISAAVAYAGKGEAMDKILEERLYMLKDSDNDLQHRLNALKK